MQVQQAQVPKLPSGQQLPTTNSITMSPLVGTYRSWISNSSVAQTLNLTLQEVIAKDTGNRYAQLTLNSQGPVGNLAIQQFIYPIFGTMTNDGAKIYGFQSLAFNSESVSPYQVALQIRIGLRGNILDPELSEITFLDCGFNAYACNNPVSSIQTGNLAR